MSDHEGAAVEDMTVEELRDELRDHDLKVSGTKDELIARLEEHDHETDDPTASSGNGPTPSLRTIVERIREDLSDVLGLEVERVTGLSRREDGWQAQVDVVEVSRVPPSTDVLATYDVATDGDGSVENFERVERFRRSEGMQR